MKLRFSIRDLFWLILVAALAIGWWLDHRRLIPYKNRQDEYELNNARPAFISQANQVQKNSTFP